MELQQMMENLHLMAHLRSPSCSPTAVGVVRIRLERGGRKHYPFYRIAVADSRFARDGRKIEYLGYYDPHDLTLPPRRIPNRDPKAKIDVPASDTVLKFKDKAVKFHINKERTKYWLSVGAQPSETVKSLLEKAEVM